MIPIRFGFFLSWWLLAITIMGWADISGHIIVSPILANVGWNLGEWSYNYIKSL
jgi:hypothetical protein